MHKIMDNKFQGDEDKIDGREELFYNPDLGKYINFKAMLLYIKF